MTKHKPTYKELEIDRDYYRRLSTLFLVFWFLTGVVLATVFGIITEDLKQENLALKEQCNINDTMVSINCGTIKFEGFTYQNIKDYEWLSGYLVNHTECEVLP